MSSNVSPVSSALISSFTGRIVRMLILSLPAISVLDKMPDWFYNHTVLWIDVLNVVHSENDSFESSFGSVCIIGPKRFFISKSRSSIALNNNIAHGCKFIIYIMLHYITLLTTVYSVWTYSSLVSPS